MSTCLPHALCLTNSCHPMPEACITRSCSGHATSTLFSVCSDREARNCFLSPLDSFLHGVQVLSVALQVSELTGERTFGSAPAPTSNSTTLTLPYKQAQCSAVLRIPPGTMDCQVHSWKCTLVGKKDFAYQVQS